jgi:hypothetical protein
MEELKFGDPDRPDEDRTSCEDEDWWAESEDEKVSEETHKSITDPT